MECALCLQLADLCDSHILPEFLYKPLYDSKHRFIGTSSDPDKRDVTLQKGARQRLLCQRCETRLSRYEDYFKRVFFDGGIVESADGQSFRIRGIDYRRVKLLFLSILWRMGASNLDFFKEVRLGPHQEKLRTMLLQDDPGASQDYGFVTIAPYLKGGRLGKFFMPPDRDRIGANSIYRIVMGGFLFIFYVPGRDVPPPIAGLFLQADGRWMIQKKRIEDIEFLYHNVITVGRGIHERRGNRIGRAR